MSVREIRSKGKELKTKLGHEPKIPDVDGFCDKLAQIVDKFARDDKFVQGFKLLKKFHEHASERNQKILHNAVTGTISRLEGVRSQIAGWL